MVWKLALGTTMAGLLLTASQVRADTRGFHIGPRPSWFVFAGATGGATLVADETGGFAGGQLSVFRLLEGRYLGLYGDAIYDFGIDATTVSLGPKFGFDIRETQTLPVKKLPVFIGIDGGPALRLGETSELGGAVRASVAIAGVFALYARYTYVPADSNEHLVQAGALLEFPLIAPF